MREAKPRAAIVFYRALILSGHRHGASALGLELPPLRLKNGGLTIECLMGPLPARLNYPRSVLWLDASGLILTDEFEHAVLRAL